MLAVLCKYARIEATSFLVCKMLEARNIPAALSATHVRMHGTSSLCERKPESRKQRVLYSTILPCPPPPPALSSESGIVGFGPPLWRFVSATLRASGTDAELSLFVPGIALRRTDPILTFLDIRVGSALPGFRFSTPLRLAED